jgi:16S rRNA (uracil1498-N3)-methyltransferase
LKNEIFVTCFWPRSLARAVLTLATAVPKGDRFDWLVEKATELGVARLVPLITARSVVHPGTSKLDRLRRRIVEASKQCGRSRLMELAVPIPWTDCVSREFSGKDVWVADPSGAPFSRGEVPSQGSVLAAIGPEGGFTPDELEAACRHGARLVALGRRILRIETAGMALSALLTVESA